MKVTVEASDLAGILKKAIRAVTKRPITTSHGMVRLEAGDGLIATATTMADLFISAKCEADVKVEGSVLVDPSLVKLANDADGALTLNVARGRMYVSGHGRANLATMSDENFPVTPTVEEGSRLNLSPEEVKSLAISVGEDYAVPENSSVHVTNGLAGTTVAGFWMTIVEADTDAEAMIPYHYMAKATMATGNTNLTLSSRSAYVSGDNVWSTFQLFDGTPLPIERFNAQVTIGTIETSFGGLIKALQLAAFYSEASCTLSTEGESLHIQSGGTMLGSYETEVAAVADREFKCRYSASRMLMALKDMREGIIEIVPMQGSDDMFILRVRRDRTQHLLSPMVVK